MDCMDPTGTLETGDLATALHAMARYGMSCDDGTFAAASAQQLQAGAAALSPGEAARALTTARELRLPVDGNWYKSIISAVCTKEGLHWADVRSLAALLQALAALRGAYAAQPQQLEALCKALQQQAATYRAGSSAITAGNASVMGSSGDAPAGSAYDATNVALEPSQNAGGAAPVTYTSLVLDSLEALAAMNARLDDAWCANVLAALLRGPLDPSDVPAAVWWLSSVAATPRSFVPARLPALEALVMHSRWALGGMLPAELARLACGCARLGLHPGAKFLTWLESACNRHERSWPPLLLCRVRQAFRCGSAACWWLLRPFV